MFFMDILSITLSLFLSGMIFTVAFDTQVMKLAELHKESSEEWSKKAGELEGVIKALEVSLCFCIATTTPFVLIPRFCQ